MRWAPASKRRNARRRPAAGGMGRRTMLFFGRKKRLTDYASCAG
jgi:hypothetical protein